MDSRTGRGGTGSGSGRGYLLEVESAGFAVASEGVSEEVTVGATRREVGVGLERGAVRDWRGRASLGGGWEKGRLYGKVRVAGAASTVLTRAEIARYTGEVDYFPLRETRDV